MPITVSQGVILVILLFCFPVLPPGSQVGEEGNMASAEHERKREEKAWRPCRGGRRNWGREQKAKQMCK